MIDVEVMGIDRLEKRFSDIATTTPVAMRKAVNAAAKMVQGSAQKAIVRQSPGPKQVRYRKGGSPRTVTVSRPGKSPNQDTGNLSKNIIVSSGVAIMTKRYEAFVRSQAPYSAALEFGTKEMKARPFMKPSLVRNKRKIMAMMAAAMRGEL